MPGGRIWRRNSIKLMPNSRQKVQVEVNKTVYTHSYLYIAAIEALKQAKLTEEGRFYSCMTAELFSAFCVEAYLNYFGNIKIPYWEKVEKKLGPAEKLEIISHELKVKLDFSREPFQSFSIMFQFRNLMVHGKTEYLAVNNLQTIGRNRKPKLPETKWESLVNLKTAMQFTKDTKNMFEILREASGIKRNTLLVPSSSAWVARPIIVSDNK